jgi:hypothetical protein
MYVLCGVILSMVAVALIFFRLDQARGKKDERMTYNRKNNFYSNAERLFLGALMRAIGNDYLILGKVRVSDLILINGGLPLKQRVAAYERIAGEYVDFVVCDRRTTKILLVVQLVRPVTAGKGVTVGLLDDAFKTASIPLIRFYEREAYEVSELRHAVYSVLGGLPDSAFARREVFE